MHLVHTDAHVLDSYFIEHGIYLMHSFAIIVALRKDNRIDSLIHIESQNSLYYGICIIICHPSKLHTHTVKPAIEDVILGACPVIIIRFDILQLK